MDDETRSLIIRHYLDVQEEEEGKDYKDRVEELYDFGLSLGILRDVLKANTRAWRYVWGILGMGALGMCTFQLSLVFIRFIESPMNTKISYKVNTSMWFPSVTICTYARVNQTSVSELNVSDSMLTYMLAAYKGMYLHYNTYNIRKDLEELEKEYQGFLKTQGQNFSLSQFFVENGFQCPAFLRVCMFQGVTFDCCEGMKEILSETGKCFVVRPKDYTAQTIPGPSGGLKVYLHNWANAYPRTMINSNPDSGIQNASSSCTVSKPLKYYKSYTYEGCFTECIADMTNRTCRCVQIGSVPDYKLLGDEALCQPQIATACVQPLLQANNMGFLWDMYDITTRCHCPLPCRQWLYDTSVSYSKIPNQGYQVVKKKELARKRLDPNLTWGGEEVVVSNKDEIILDLYYDKLVYTVTEEVPLVDFTLFLSQVGGQLSMWLGIRLVTLGHLIFYGAVVVMHILPVWWHRLHRWRAGRVGKGGEEDSEEGGSPYPRSPSILSSYLPPPPSLPNPPSTSAPLPLPINILSPLPPATLSMFLFPRINSSGSFGAKIICVWVWISNFSIIAPGYTSISLSHSTKGF